MNQFGGFTDRETFIPVPDSFFATLLNEIDDADELKVTLYLLWRISHAGGRFRALSRADILADEAFMSGIDPIALDSGLEKAVRRGSLLFEERPLDSDEGGWYMLNSPRGRAAAQAMSQGEWLEPEPVPPPPAARPNVFKLYEDHFGPLTPLIADMLRDAEQTYPEDWISDAMAEAVKRDKRSWKYVEAILKRWKQEGRHEGKNRKHPRQSPERYVQSAFSEYLERD